MKRKFADFGTIYFFVLLCFLGADAARAAAHWLVYGEIVLPWQKED